MHKISTAQRSECSHYRIKVMLVCGVNTLDSSLGSTVRRCSVSLVQSSVTIFFSLALITLKH